MKLLFEMPYPGYLRMYESTIRLLAERGHEVLLAYDSPDKKGTMPLVPSGVGPGVRFAGAVPWRRRLWSGLARHARIGADYLRYLDPGFAHAGFLRRRMEKYLPPRLAFLTRIRGLRHGTVQAWTRAMFSLERLIPTDPEIDAFISALKPDAVVVTPLVTRGEGAVRQTETVKSAKKLGIPVAVAVASWDHLTSKGMIRVQPDLVVVWNDVQKREAVELHGIAAERVAVTGAQLFDHWFERRPLVDRDEFHRKAGLATKGPYILYAGSSRGIAPAEAELAFVRRWIGALRSSPDPALRNLAVLVRPHPMNADHWRRADLTDLADVAIWLHTPAVFPMTEQDQADYFHSLHYSVGVVGINTSAMIEAAIVGRPVYTIRGQELSSNQEGTVHFHYLLPEGGGCLRAANDLPEHLAQVADGLRRPERTETELSGFVRSFVRPHGLDVPCTPLVADAFERLAATRNAPVACPAWLLPARGLLACAAWWLSEPASDLARDGLRRPRRTGDRATL